MPSFSGILSLRLANADADATLGEAERDDNEKYNNNKSRAEVAAVNWLVRAIISRNGCIIAQVWGGRHNGGTSTPTFGGILAAALTMPRLRTTSTETSMAGETTTGEEVREGGRGGEKHG